MQAACMRGFGYVPAGPAAQGTVKGAEVTVHIPEDIAEQLGDGVILKRCGLSFAGRKYVARP